MTITPDGPLFTGLPVPAPDGFQASAPYWRALREHTLVLQRCASCGVVRSPPSELCYRCLSFEAEWVPFSPEGTIFSWTRVWHAANESVAEHVPYVLLWVVVDPRSGSRVLGNLVGDPSDDVRIGARVVGVFQDRPDGTVLNWMLAGG